MAHLTSLSNLTTGAILAAPIKDCSGNTLLPPGTVLTESLLYLLYLWNVSSAVVSNTGTGLIICDEPALDCKFRLDILRDIKSMESTLARDKQLSLERLTGQLQLVITELSKYDKVPLCLAALRGLDDYTYSHSLSTAIISMSIGIKLQWAKEDIVELGLAAILHDMGKAKIPLAILQKPGSLSPDEWALMTRHPQYGYAMLKRHGGFNDKILGAVLQHHERLNGSGYPQRLHGKDINCLAKIVAIADVYDAMTSDRCYKNASSVHLAAEQVLLNENLFDQPYARTLVSMLDIFPHGSRVLLDSGAEGVVVASNPEHPTRPQLLLVKDAQGLMLKPPVPCDLIRNQNLSIIKTVAN